ncbi:P-loop containing nucleoside triphosphate hydrolase protein [Paraphoma chrysanthemicola]|uniref:P-loop containing nucleoside triphosphate hydrolase protein n=1 Tax=Paraphoma chrysanthemicola TaxID=798071 RepID=A0A8K0R363_9PLEO|nr:P-loop containing nucleoside triphosphate hydrolase protein [Paraphoma chrysanthemicola]
MTKHMIPDNLDGLVLDLARRVEEILLRQACHPRQRILVALAGVPGSGKSTVSQALIAELATRGVCDVAVVPMDGFHYTQKVLLTFEDADNAFRRRGAPFTFDVQAFRKLVTVLKTTPVTAHTETEKIIAVPSFDHALKDPVDDSIFVSSRTRLVIVEGNYTLLDKAPWKDIAQYFEAKWFVDAPVEVVRDRLAERHLAAGIETSLEAARRRAEENDIPNGALIRSLLIKPDVYIMN